MPKKSSRKTTAQDLPWNLQKQAEIMTPFLATTPLFHSIMKERLENGIKQD
jgi:predicted molibdopterin-dependent oxidoreductase YjgC